MTFDRLPNDWTGRTVYVIGGGPSLRGFEWDRLRGRGVVLAVNDAMLHCPHASAVFTIDTMWLRKRCDALLAFPGERWAAIPAEGAEGIPEAGVRYVERVRAIGVSPDPRKVYTGENSGFAAVGMAIQRGASRIALLGFDMTGPGHFHAGYEWGSRYGARHYRTWAQWFNVLQQQARLRKVAIINCNPRSAIRAFTFGEPEDVAECAS